MQFVMCMPFAPWLMRMRCCRRHRLAQQQLMCVQLCSTWRVCHLHAAPAGLSAAFSTPVCAIVSAFLMTTYPISSPRCIFLANPTIAMLTPFHTVPCDTLPCPMCARCPALCVSPQSLGKRLGKDMGKVAGAIKGLTAQQLLEYEASGTISVAGHTLAAGDIKVGGGVSGVCVGGGGGNDRWLA